MSAGTLRVGLVQAIRPPIVAKEFRRRPDGSVGKRAVASISEGRYRSKPAASAALAAILRTASERHDTYLLLDTLKGDQGQVVRILPDAPRRIRESENIEYVALTRHLNELVFLAGESS